VTTLRHDATLVTTVGEARKLGRYVLIGEIAEGGFGRVYLARQLGAAGFERIVAVKVMLTEKADERQGMAEMFFDEARIASMIEHPNVCTVFDYGEANGVHYIVMEYLAGRPVMDIIAAVEARPGFRSEPLFYPLLARVIAEAAEGLHGAHTALDERGNALEVVHRDVSPENVFVTYDGIVKVMDFGIARATGRIHETAAGTFKGKLPYASPQALMLEPLDPRADVWSLGVVFWELLTGRGCFIRPSQMEVFGAVLKEPLVRPSAYCPDVPSELDAICMLALSRELEGRYPTMRHMARDLNKYALSAGTHIGSGEMAEWMERLFPGGHDGAKETEGAARRFEASLEEVPELDEDAVARPLVSRIVTRAEGRVISGFDDVDPHARTVAAPSGSGRIPSDAVAAFDDAPTMVDPEPAGSRPPPSPSHAVPLPPRSQRDIETDTLEDLPPVRRGAVAPPPGAAYPQGDTLRDHPPFAGQRAIATDTLEDQPAVQPPTARRGGAAAVVLKVLIALVVLAGAVLVAELLSR
jgi:serine/threonine-protein kinase